MDRWKDWSSWTSETLRREAFFLDFHSMSLHASLYAHPRVEPGSPGVIICQSWGIEADRTNGFAHGLALGTARLGGVALLLHYPGYGDSTSNGGALTVASLAEAVTAGAEEARRRFDGLDWVVAGLMLGAPVAVASAEAIEPDKLLLVQPTLDTHSYFEELMRRSRRGALGAGGMEAFAFGYPVPDGLRSDDQALATATTALEKFRGSAAVIRYAESPSAETLPAHVERIEVPGTWRFGMTRHPGLLDGAISWLGRTARDRASAGELRP